MATASLASVAVSALLPRSLDAAAGERVRRALGQPLVDAVPRAFDGLDGLDPGAYWVIRQAQAQVLLVASEPDPERAAAAIADAMAAAVAHVVREGPSGNAVRFADAAAYVAAYVAARLAGHGEGWVFERLAPLASLSALAALPAAARIVGADLLEALTALARTTDLGRALDVLATAELEPLIQSLARLPGAAGPPDQEAVAALAALRADDPAAVRGRTAAHRRLVLLALRARATSLTVGDLAAAWRLEPEPPAAAARAGWGWAGPAASPGGGVGGGAATHADAGAGTDRRWPADDSPDVGPYPLRCAGAPAFLLLGDLAEVLSVDGVPPWLLLPEPSAAAVRAAALAAVLGRGVDLQDPALRLAAGLEAGDRDGADLPVLDGDLTALLADPLLGWSHPADADWFAPLLGLLGPPAPGAGATEPLARALARRFAAHLPGFGRTGLPYLAERLLPLGGTVRVAGDAVLVDLPRPPLHVLLALAGLDTVTCQVPWLELPVLLTHEDG